MEKFEERELIELDNQGQKIFGVFHKPLKEGKVPAVLFCHGLAGHKIGKHRMYVQLAETLARKGIAALRVDFRGSGDSEGPFSEMTFSGQVSDAMLCLDWLSKRHDVDEDDLGIFGRSFGGAIAIMVSHRFEKIKSIALWASIYDVEQWEKQWEMVQTGQVDDAQRHEMMRINGQLPSLDFYAEMFQMDLKNDLDYLQKTPMFLIHGEQDPVVGIEHAEKFQELRRSASAETKFYRLPHSDHDFTHPEEKLFAINKTCEWFYETLVLAPQPLYLRLWNKCRGLFPW